MFSLVTREKVWHFSRSEGDGITAKSSTSSRTIACRRSQENQDVNRLIIWYDLAGDPPAPLPHPIELFCQTHIEVAEGGYIEELDAYNHQAPWMFRNGYNILDTRQFSRTLRKLYPAVRRRKRMVDSSGFLQKKWVLDRAEFMSHLFGSPRRLHNVITPSDPAAMK